MKKYKIVMVFATLTLACLTILSGCSAQDKGLSHEISANSWNTVVPFEYDSVSISEKGTFVSVIKNQKYGVFAKNGEKLESLFPPEFDMISWSASEEYLYCQTGDIIKIYEANGEKVTDQSFSKVFHNNQKGFQVLLNDHWGYISENGDWILQPNYAELSLLAAEDRFLVRQQDLRYHIIDSNGISQFPSNLTIAGHLQNDFLFDYMDVTNSDQLTHGIATVEGDIIVPISYKAVSFFQYSATDGLFLCVDNENRWSAINKDGSIILKELDFDKITPINTTNFIVEKDKKTGLIDNNGYLIFPMEYDGIYFTENSNVGSVKKGNLFYFATIDGKVNESAAYDSLLQVKNGDGLYSASQNHKIGFVNKNGTAAADFEYDYTDIGMYNELILVKKNGKYGFVSPKNQIVIDFDFTYASSFEQGYALVVKEDRLGIIDQNGSCIVPFEFDVPFESKENNVITNHAINNIQPLKKDGKWGCIELKFD